MKILLVITGLGVGGAERLVTNLSDKFVQAGHEVTLAYFVGPADMLPRDSRVKLVFINFSKSPHGIIKGFINLRKLVKQFKPDVINSHMFHSNIVCRLLRFVAPVKRLISSAHSTYEGGKLRMLAYRVTDQLSDITTNVSRNAVETFVAKRAVPFNRIIPVLNGIDTDEFSYRSDSRYTLRKKLLGARRGPLVLAVGRLWPEKDYPNLLSALSTLLNRGYNPLLLIAGVGPEKPALEALALALGISDHVCFLGLRTDIPALMSASDVYVLPSAWEGFGLAVAEAMATERIVVATDSGGVKEVLGNAGILVPPKNPLLLAAGLEKAFNFKDSEIELMGKEARNRVIENYSLDNTAQQYIRIYDGSF